MITGELKSQVDKIWEAFWTGGTSNPLIQELIQYQMLKELEEMEAGPYPLPVFKCEETKLLYEIENPKNVVDLLAVMRALPDEGFLQDVEFLINEFVDDYRKVRSRGGKGEFALLVACLLLADRKVGLS